MDRISGQRYSRHRRAVVRVNSSTFSPHITPSSRRHYVRVCCRHHTGNVFSGISCQCCHCHNSHWKFPILPFSRHLSDAQNIITNWQITTVVWLLHSLSFIYLQQLNQYRFPAAGRSLRRRRGFFSRYSRSSDLLQWAYRLVIVDMITADSYYRESISRI